MAGMFSHTRGLELVETLRGVGFILGVVVLTEVGDVQRFPSSSHLASYSGMTPRVHASGGRVRYGRTRPDVNRYLKWVYAEAANATMIDRRRHPKQHVSRLYERVRQRGGHQKTIGAVGRHLSWGDVLDLAEEGTVSRPHTGSRCVEKGGVSAAGAWPNEAR